MAGAKKATLTKIVQLMSQKVRFWSHFRANHLAHFSKRFPHFFSAGYEVPGPIPHTWITHSSPFAPS